MRRWMIIGLLLTTGCLEQNKPAAKPLVPITRVPAVVRRQAMVQLPGVKYHTAWMLPNGGYQLRGNDTKGTAHDIELTADGSVIKVN
jgi:hypothetical protein